MRSSRPPSVASADPLLDVAAFLADLTVRGVDAAVPRSQVRIVARAFTDEYFRRVALPRDERLSRLYAGALLKRASKTVRRRQPGWQDHVERFVREAERALETSAFHFIPERTSTC